LRRGAGRGRGAAFHDRFQPADRREHHRQPGAPAEECRSAVDPTHVAQHAWSKRDGVERLPVAAHGGLGFGAADEVAPRAGRQVAARRGDDLLQGQEFLSVRRIHLWLLSFWTKSMRIFAP